MTRFLCETDKTNIVYFVISLKRFYDGYVRICKMNRAWCGNKFRKSFLHILSLGWLVILYSFLLHLSCSHQNLKMCTQEQNIHLNIVKSALCFPCQVFTIWHWLNAGRLYIVLLKKLCNNFIPVFLWSSPGGNNNSKCVFPLRERVAALRNPFPPTHRKNLLYQQNRRLSYWANKSEKFWLLTYWWDKSHGWGIIVQLAEHIFSDPPPGLGCCTAGAMLCCCQGLSRITKIPLIKGKYMWRLSSPVISQRQRKLWSR